MQNQIITRKEGGQKATETTPAGITSDFIVFPHSSELFLLRTWVSLSSAFIPSNYYQSVCVRNILWKPETYDPLCFRNLVKPYRKMEPCQDSVILLFSSGTGRLCGYNETTARISLKKKKDISISRDAFAVLCCWRQTWKQQNKCHIIRLFWRFALGEKVVFVSVCEHRCVWCVRLYLLRVCRGALVCVCVCGLEVELSQ